MCNHLSPHYMGHILMGGQEETLGCRQVIISYFCTSGQPIAAGRGACICLLSLFVHRACPLDFCVTQTQGLGRSVGLTSFFEGRKEEVLPVLCSHFVQETGSPYQTLGQPVRQCGGTQASLSSRHTPFFPSGRCPPPRHLLSLR